jgi:transposase-like protein
MTRRKPGRPRVLTPEKMDVVVEYVRKGNWLTVAAANAGIGYSTLNLWLQRARDARDAAEPHNPTNPTDPDWRPIPIPDDMRPYVAFLERVERAHAEGESHAVEALHTAIEGGFVVRRRHLPDGSLEEEVAPPDGKLALNYLAVRDPERWGRTPTQRIEVTGRDGGAIAVEASSSVDALAERFAGLRAIESGPADAKGVEGYEDAEIVEDDTALASPVTG